MRSPFLKFSLGISSSFLKNPSALPRSTIIFPNSILLTIPDRTSPTQAICYVDEAKLRSNGRAKTRKSAELEAAAIMLKMMEDNKITPLELKMYPVEVKSTIKRLIDNASFDCDFFFK